MRLEPVTYGVKVWAAALVLTLAAIALVVAVWVMLLVYVPPIPAIMFTAAFAIVLSLPLGRVISWLAKG